MNTAIENTNYQAAPPRRFCAKCSSITATNEIVCPQCGKKLETVNRIRVTGAISVVLGIFLLVVMSWLLFWIYNAVTANSANSARFNGSAQDLGLIVFVFGLVLTTCFFGIVAGLWQLIFGTRNKILKYIVLILGLAFIGTGLMFTFSKPL